MSDLNKELPHEDKFKKLLAMLSVLKEDNEDSVFYDLYEILRIWNGISENFVNTVYQIIIDLIASIGKEDMDEAASKIEDMKSMMESMRKEEVEESEKDESESETDRLLNEI